MKKLLFSLALLYTFQFAHSQSQNPIVTIPEIPVQYDFYNQCKLGTAFKTLDDGYLLKIRLLLNDNEPGERIIKLWENSGIQNILLSGPYVWNITSGNSGWYEFEFPYPIPLIKNRVYIISIGGSINSNSTGRISLLNEKNIENDRILKEPKSDNRSSPVSSNWYIVNSPRLNVIVNIRLAPGTIGYDQIICFNGIPKTLKQITPPSGGTGTYIYQWQSSFDTINWTDIAGANLAAFSPPPLKTNTWYRRKVTSGTDKDLTSNSVLISVYPLLSAGTIGVPQTICYNAVPSTLKQINPPSGGSGSFSYQWQISSDNLFWTDISEANLNEYSPPGLTESKWYRCKVICDSCGIVTSNEVLVTVIPELSAGTISADQSICYNTIPVSLIQTTSPSGGNGNYSYQWQISTDSLNWTNIPGANSATYSPPALNISSWYRRNITSGNCETKSSNPVQITVYPDLVAGTIGTTQTICYNSVPATLTQITAASGGTGAFNYQWQISQDNSSWSDIPGANQVSYSPVTLTVSTWYRRNITSGTCDTESSNSVQVIVNARLTAGTIGINQSICYNNTPSSLSQLTAPSGGTGSYSYQWQNSSDNINWINISGGNSVTYSPPSLTTNTWYKRIVTSGNCGTETSNTILITVHPTLNPGTIERDQTICYNSVPATLVQVNAPSGGTGEYGFQWQRSSDNFSWTNISNANSATYLPPVLTANTWYRRNITSGNCEIQSSNSVEITVYPDLVAGTIGTAQTICFNSAPETLTEISSPSGGTGAFIYQWQISQNNSSWSNIQGANQAAYSPAALTESTWYRRNVTSGSCETESSNSLQITVNANLMAGAIGSNQSICYNETPATLTQLAPPTGGTGSYSYQWQTSPDNVNWINITGGNSAAYSPPSLTANTWYRRNVTSGSCGTVTSNAILITVYPTLNAGSIEADQTICYNTVPATLIQTIAPSGGTGEYTFQWQSSPDNLSWTNINNANNANYSPPSLTSSSWFRRNVASGCIESSNSVRINLYARLNSAQLHDNQTIYENTSTTFNVAISGGTPPFTVRYTVNEIEQPAITNYVSGTDLSTGVLTAGTYNYSLTSVTDLNGCFAQSLGTNIIITVRSELATLTNKALIIVNSASASYSEYTTYIKPYMDNFGIPYDICNINSTALPSFTDYAVIIFGHKNVYSSGYPITQLEAAISEGTGLYSFDPHLFDYSSGFNSLITQRSVSSSQINIPNTTHYITQYHVTDSYNTTNNLVNFRTSWTVAQRSSLTGGINLATMTSGGQTVALLQVSNYGNGKVVKWCGYDWVFERILGPVYGMDDLLWRGIVWAARKPFVMQGMPPLITMRVDDAVGQGGGVINNFEWIKISNEFGIIPWCGTFINAIPQSYIPTLKSLTDNNHATSSPHAFGGSTFIYFNHNNLPSFDAAANARTARDFYIQHGLKISKYFVPHYYEVSSTALPVIRDMGGEFLGIHMLPDNFYYSPTPWINCGPYRINRNGMSDYVGPVYYGGYVNLSGIQFFNCLTEIRDDGGYEWYPDNNVSTTVARGIRHLRRSLNSMVLANLFTHEHFFAEISTTNWREILRQITSAISGYSPEYRSMDYAAQYLRAKVNIRITNVVDNISYVEISYTGNNDLNTKCYFFTEQNGQITYSFVILPRTNGSNQVTVSK